MTSKKYLLLIISAFLIVFSSCKEQGSSFISWRKTDIKTMITINNALLHISADIDSATSIENYYAEIDGRIFKKSDSLQILYFGHCYSNTVETPFLTNSQYSLFKTDTIPSITAETTDFSFTSIFTDLELDTLYYARSFTIVKYNSGLIDTGYNQNITTFRTNAENIWFHKTDFNGDARTEATSFVLDNKAYLFGGFDGVTLRKDFWVYNPSDDNWEQVSNFTSSRMSAAAFVLNDTAYAGTGITQYSPEVQSSDMYKWTELSNFWFRIDSLGENQERSNAVGFALTDKFGEKKGYIGLGKKTYAASDISWYKQENDYAGAPTGNAWVQTATFIGDARTEAVVAVINNRAIVGGGSDSVINGNVFNDYYMLDPTSGISGSWSSIPPAPVARTNAVAFAISFTRPRTGEQFNYFYFGTGKDQSGGLHRDWWRYNFSTTEWEECSEIHEKEDYADNREGAIAFTIILGHADFGTVERGFVALGHNGSTYKKDVWEYLP